MAIDFSKIYVTSNPLAAPPPDFTDTAGAILDFYGVVRASEGDQTIAGLDYEAYAEMAESKLRQIAAETQEKHGLAETILIHRVGFVPAGEASLFLRVRSGHRGEAFAAGREIIERLKQEVPIWKNPVAQPAL